MKHFYLFVFCSLLLMASLSGQKPTYHEGKLYFKLHNEAGITLPELSSKEELILLEAYQVPALVALFRQFEVYQLERAFDGMGSADLDNTYTVLFEKKGLGVELMDRLMGLSIIDYAERSPLCYPQYTPNDLNTFTQWDMAKIGATAAWDISTGSDKVIIGVVDNGFLLTHRDLAANLWTNDGEIPGNGIDDDGNGYIDDVDGWDAADEDNDPSTPQGLDHTHGTQVAGSASAVTDNNTDIASIGFSCKIMPVKVKRNVVDPNNPRGFFNSTEGIAYAVANDAHIINMSFGGAGFSQTAQNVINLGHSKGIIFVGASGNDSSNIALYPASYNHVISVGATNRNDVKTVFSNWANSVDLVAPGKDIVTISHNGFMNPLLQTVDGTSFSCPIVSGTIGLMLSINPCLSSDDVETILDTTATDISALNPNFPNGIGAGRLNAAAALAAAAPSTMPVAVFDMIDSCGNDIQFRYGGPLSSCGQNFFWTFNGLVSTLPNASFPHPGAGTYSLTLVVNSSLGTANTSQMITLGDPIGIDAGGDANGVLTACFGQLLNINATSTLPNASYSWSPAAGLINSSSLTPSLTANAPKTFTLTATNNMGCTLIDQVHVLPINSVFAGQDQTINLGDSAQLNVTVVGNSGYQYEWSPATGLSNPFIKNPKASPASTTTYTVTVTTGTGCELEDEVTVTTVVGLEDDFAAVGSILPAYPNPASQEVTLSAKLNQHTALRLTAYDLQGREVAIIFDGQAPSGHWHTLWQRTNTLQAGMYLLVWQTPEAHFVQKIYWK